MHGRLGLGLYLRVNVDVVQFKFAIEGLDGLLEFVLERLLQGGEKKRKEAGSRDQYMCVRERESERARLNAEQVRRGGGATHSREGRILILDGGIVRGGMQ